MVWTLFAIYFDQPAINSGIDLIWASLAQPCLLQQQFQYRIQANPMMPAAILPAVALSLLYFAETSINDGSMIFLPTAWHAPNFALPPTDIFTAGSQAVSARLAVEMILARIDSTFHLVMRWRNKYSRRADQTNKSGSLGRCSDNDLAIAGVCWPAVSKPLLR